MTTRAEYYIRVRGAVWRKARVTHRCDWKHNGFRCRYQIQPGEQYFDTKLINPDSSNPHATYRICCNCAGEEIKV